MMLKHFTFDCSNVDFVQKFNEKIKLELILIIVNGSFSKHFV